jgi:signal transduction histidine kinase
MSSAASSTERLLLVLQKALGHELPNQLIAVQGLARVLDLESGERLSAEGREYLTRLSAAAQRTHEFIRALADLVRAVRTAPPDQPTSVSDVARQTIAELKQLFPGRGIDYHLPQAELLLSVPAAGLRQVFLHLLRNALQAASPERSPRVEVGARETAEGVEFWVADNGRGLSAEAQQRLFEPFVRSLAGAGGIGLGLNLVRILVESWSGRLRVDSNPGQGSTFTVYVPRKVDERRSEVAPR